MPTSPSPYLDLPLRSLDAVMAARAKHMSSTETAAPDPLVEWVASRFRIEAAAEAQIDPLDDLDPDEYAEMTAVLTIASKQIADIDDRICRHVATSAVGLIAQVRVLYELGSGEHSDDDADHDGLTGERLLARIIEGIERLAGLTRIDRGVE